MATASSRPLARTKSRPTSPSGIVAGIYDRSSITADAMVVIEGQTSEDFEKYAPETRYCDYIEGKVYMPSPVSRRHQVQTRFLLYLLTGYPLLWDVATVLMGPAVMRIGEEYKPEPDVFVEPNEIGPGIPPALLAVEVHSPSTRSHDLGLKLRVYQEAGIPEVWMVDDDRKSMLVVTKNKRRGYRRRTLKGGVLVCTAIPGFWIDVDWLWQDPPPREADCLARILAGPPA